VEPPIEGNSGRQGKEEKNIIFSGNLSGVGILEHEGSRQQSWFFKSNLESQKYEEGDNLDTSKMKGAVGWPKL